VQNNDDCIEDRQYGSAFVFIRLLYARKVITGFPSFIGFVQYVFWLRTVAHISFYLYIQYC